MKRGECVYKSYIFKGRNREDETVGNIYFKRKDAMSDAKRRKQAEIENGFTAAKYKVFKAFVDENGNVINERIYC